MLKSYRVGWVVVVVVAHKILLSTVSPSPLDWGLGLDNLGVGKAAYMLVAQPAICKGKVRGWHSRLYSWHNQLYVVRGWHSQLIFLAQPAICKGKGKVMGWHSRLYVRAKL